METFHRPSKKVRLNLICKLEVFEHVGEIPEVKDTDVDTVGLVGLILSRQDDRTPYMGLSSHCNCCCRELTVESIGFGSGGQLDILVLESRRFFVVPRHPA